MRIRELLNLNEEAAAGTVSSGSIDRLQMPVRGGVTRRKKLKHKVTADHGATIKEQEDDQSA